MITYIHLTEKKPDPQIHKMIVAKTKPEFDGGWTLLFASEVKYPHYYDYAGEEIPIDAIEKWLDVTE